MFNRTLKNRINFLEIKVNDEQIKCQMLEGKVERLEDELYKETKKAEKLKYEKERLEIKVAKLNDSLNNIPKERVIELATEILLKESKDIERDSLKQQITTALTIRSTEPQQPEGGVPLV
ncbi:hypothetical protein PP654_gp014 [Bacillus phage v_B-Bak10]|uniref:Uncharacterized protein n=1 Tax=Bacillus phage v_B-Bak10 TaxID=2094736 RepID=A0A385IK29_9CAUD|nr:hypothetical protein PP654_gp014 [Bacillus phage v_B-Bak10]AXY83264.1 hypothetical protein vBBBak10_014 [Bacillus phage v_B-Bak10]